jgi:hypothetical protein
MSKVLKSAALVTNLPTQVSALLPLTALSFIPGLHSAVSKSIFLAKRPKLLDDYQL